MILLALALALAVQAPPVEVVVVARRRRCDTKVADRILSDREFDRRAAEWAAGTAVRVSVADQSTRRCLARIVFRLADHGVRLVDFGEAPNGP